MIHRILWPATVLLASACSSVGGTPPSAPVPASTMDLGAFSVSLAVKDIAASRAFYEKLGFHQVGGNQQQKWLVLRNGDSKIGLFQGMFPTNILTFNPGWTPDATPMSKFDDVRVLQQRLEKAGLKLTSRADETTKGPASLTLVDPDGNVILFDQHVP